jgi:CPA1 family monovalent cation:H+ antiporter
MAQLELILLLLAASVALQVLAMRLTLPHPALLVLGGAALALVPGLPRPGLDPEVIFLVFVPPLLYIASIGAPLREFGRHFWPIFQLSVPLVLVSMVAVALVAHELSPAFTWPAAFVLGAIVSPPDPVATVAVMRPLRAPGAVTAVLEGEGMFNDATALVAYRIAVAAAVTGTFSLLQAAEKFAWSGTLGVAVGLVVGWTVLIARRRVQDLPLVDNSISLLTPFLAYLPADALGASGVLAVVAAGIYTGQHVATSLAPAARIQTGTTWSVVGFLLESLVFILIGLELPHIIQDTKPGSLVQLLGFSAAISLVVILVRIAWVLPGVGYRGRVLHKGRHDLHSRREVALLAWTGVRGADSVIIALALPYLTASGAPFPARGLIVFTTFGVVFATLVLQGLSLKPLVRLLRLDGDTQSAREEAHARHVMGTSGLRRLDELEGTSGVSPDVVEELRTHHQRRVRGLVAEEQRFGGDLIGPHDAEHGDDGSSLRSYRRLRAAMIAAERRAVVKLSKEGVIGADVLRRIQRDLDLESMLLRETPSPRPK